MKDEWQYEQDAEYDRILGQTTGLLAQRGDHQAVALLVDVRAIALVNTDEVIRTQRILDTEGWSGEETITQTIYRRAALFDVDEHLVVRFTDEICQRIAQTLSYVADRNGEPDVAYVKVQPALPEVDGNWRTSYADRLTGERPSNQARREVGVSKYPVDDGLTFGSAEELQVYHALKRLQCGRFPEHATIAIIPLPGVRLRSGHTWSPDVMVIGQGRAVIFETDGPHHRNVRRYADDRNRDLQWQRCGVPVVRLPVEDLGNAADLEARLLEEIRRNLGRKV
ncbi:hypothetical protein Acy02nite_88580 [Actinoplanes cyaneus]|uniref:DUF559 domain-containing protein n=1 Tax=Actinoplanes cyaneus TaxID=52696 RepID=A0A919ITF9_9ACTN|nr:hypothetical protein [Actinoplanes cyaneus]MCW2144203.1 hypothetical protein [Actinoplanes cyaneus]GID70977.1 hypothetical protein Acy02nite_88580 [Actinoplanes cyaneus]